MFIQSFILCIVAIMLLFYKKFNNRNYYKTISDKQHKVLYISNIINFRNSLFDYCNSLDLLDVKYEIENNDLIYMVRLLQIKNKIDNYYKQINDDLSDDDEEENNITDIDDGEDETDMNSDGNITDDDDETDMNSDGNITDDDDNDDNNKTDVNTEVNTEVNTDDKTDMNTDVNTDVNTYVNIDDNIKK